MRTLGRYVLQEEIGRGSMGTVFKASDPMIERTVAIKTINALQIQDGSVEPRRRFLREAKAAGRLSHPCIVTIYDVGEFEDIAYIVMELLEGRSLKDILDREERISLATAVHIILQTADALGFAHKQGVVHRDIKPGNLMLTKQGLVKITDFGIARIDQMSRTRTGVVIGSPRYMSPEQVSGKKADGRSDVFSLGIVLYELATGVAPFDAARPEDFLTLMQNIVSKEPKPASALNAEVPAALDAIIDRALRKNPDQRYATADKLAEDLREVLQGEFKSKESKSDIAALAATDDLVMPEFDLFAATTEPATGEQTAAPSEARAAAKPASRAGADGSASLLERLKNEAEALENAGSNNEVAAETLMLALDIERKMRAGFAFCEELVRYLGIVKPEIVHDYALDGVGAFARPKLADAFVDSKLRRADGRPWMDMITLTVVCVSPTTLRCERAAADTQQLIDRLTAANLRYTSDDAASGRNGGASVFEVAGEITIYARIMADRARGRLAFLCKNVAQFGSQNIVLDGKAARENVFEEFAKYLLGQPSQFLQIADRSAVAQP
ncbi:MAG: serine/threonine protein kinase [Betaproteobacteria bacterium]|jgi:serine/threonine-protein kinase|nr:serine/threonine protein kinase [Betaproteobacteria bacterium]